MNKQKLTFENLLTWDDVIQLGSPTGEAELHFNEEFLLLACEKNYNKNMLKHNANLYIGGALKKYLPDFPFPVEDMSYGLHLEENEDNIWRLKLSKPYFVTWLLNEASGDSLGEDNQKEIIGKLLKCRSKFKELTVSFLNEYKFLYNEAINNCNGITSSMHFNPTIAKISNSDKNHLLDMRKSVNWCIRNIDSIFEFLDMEVNIELLSAISKDNFLLALAGRALSFFSAFDLINGGYTVETYLNKVKKNGTVIGMDYVNNYRLMVDYLNSENDEIYSAKLNCELDGKSKYILTSESIIDIFKQVESIIGNNSEYINRPNRFTSYEEFLSTKVSKTWKKIQGEKLVNKIKMNWEMIPAGEKFTLTNYTRDKKQRIISNAEKQNKMKLAYDLVDSKMNYFSKTNPILELVGINTFEGYSAYMYNNGVVVFEKFFKNGNKHDRNLLVPVSGEAIYVMNYREFADLSRYSKMELIQEINDYNNPDVKRVYHTKNNTWKAKVDSIIHGAGYGGLELDELDTITNQLVKGKEKIKEY